MASTASHSLATQYARRQPPLKLHPSMWTADHWYVLSLKAGYSKEHWKAVAGITEAQYETSKNEVKQLIDKHGIIKSAVTTEKQILYGDVAKILRRAIKLPTFTKMPEGWWTKVLKKCADDINRYYPTAKALKDRSLLATRTRIFKNLKQEEWSSEASSSPSLTHSSHSYCLPALTSGTERPTHMVHNSFTAERSTSSITRERRESTLGTSVGPLDEQSDSSRREIVSSRSSNESVRHAVERAKLHKQNHSADASCDDEMPDALSPTKPTFCGVPLLYAVVEVNDLGIIKFDIQFIDLAFDSTNEWSWQVILRDSGIDIMSRSRCYEGTKCSDRHHRRMVSGG